jgi:type IV secretion system protein VirD4
VIPLLSELPTTGLLESGVTLAAGITAAGVLAYKTARKRRARPNHNLHGDARFMTAAELRRTGLLGGNSGVYLAGWRDRRGWTHYLRDDSNGHIAVFGPTRSGKTASAMMTLLSWPESLIAIDEKRELWELSAGWRQREANNRVYRWEPAAEAGSAAFNFLDQVRLGTVFDIADAQNIAQCLVDYRGYGIDALDHWQKASLSLLSGCILHECYKARTDGRTASLADVAAAVNGSNGDTKMLWEAMRDNKHKAGDKPHLFIAGAGRSQIERSERERSSVLSSLNTYLILFADPIIKSNTDHSDFSLADLADHDQPVSVYIVTPGTDKERLRPLVRLFLTMAMRHLMSAELKFENGRPVPPHKHALHLMLEELPSIGRMELVEAVLARGAGYRIKATIICQSHEQLVAVYGQANSIIANCATRVIYGANDQPTAKWVSDLCGQTTAYAEHVMESGYRIGIIRNFTRTYQEVARPLLLPDQVLTLRKATFDANGNITAPGETIVLLAGARPIKAEQVFYWSHPEFARRAAISPP